jgi:flagellar hook-length control protein FliK
MSAESLKNLDALLASQKNRVSSKSHHEMRHKGYGQKEAFELPKDGDALKRLGARRDEKTQRAKEDRADQRLQSRRDARLEKGEKKDRPEKRIEENSASDQRNPKAYVDGSKDAVAPISEAASAQSEDLINTEVKFREGSVAEDAQNVTQDEGAEQSIQQAVAPIELNQNAQAAQISASIQSNELKVVSGEDAVRSGVLAANVDLLKKSSSENGHSLASTAQSVPLTQDQQQFEGAANDNPTGMFAPENAEDVMPADAQPAIAKQDADGSNFSERLNRSLQNENGSTTSQQATSTQQMSPESPQQPQSASLQNNAQLQQSTPILRTVTPQNLGAVPLEIATHAMRGKTTFDIRLDPAELGKIHVKLEIQNGGRARARLVVDKVEALEALKSDLGNLAESLQQAGLQIDLSSMDLSLSGQSSNKSGSQDGQSDNWANQIPKATGSDRQTIKTNIVAVERAQLSHANNQLDLVV